MHIYLFKILSILKTFTLIVLYKYRQEHMLDILFQGIGNKLVFQPRLAYSRLSYPSYIVSLFCISFQHHMPSTGTHLLTY